MSDHQNTFRAAIVGGGPAGLMAAEALLRRGASVDLYDAMASLGRKLLMAGKSGLNLTHAEPFERFIERFAPGAKDLRPMLEAFGPDHVQDWARDLGVDVFTGTSGRVFPKDFKAAPLLRAWLRRLRAQGLRVHVRHKWQGWDDRGHLQFDTPDGQVHAAPDVTILALGGASWPKLGSDAHWVGLLQARGVDIAPLKPANCGFDCALSDAFIERFEGQPVKRIALAFDGHRAQGECVITKTGLEGGPVYALSSAIRDAIDANGPVTVHIDLLSDLSEDDIAKRLAKPRGKASWATHLKKTVKIEGAKAGLLREGTDTSVFDDTKRLAHALKALPVTFLRPRPIIEAISTAGGITWDALDADLQLKALPGVYVCGEMMGWDAPTGGYLLTACMATGRWVGERAINALHLTTPDQSTS